MQGPTSHFCRIICSNRDDYELISSEYGNFQVEVCEDPTFASHKNGDIPTLLLGWNLCKKTFHKLRISKKNISKNLYWAFSGDEDKAEMQKDVYEFIFESFKKFIPKKYQAYDFIIDGDFEKELHDKLNGNLNFFFFGENESLYIYNKNCHLGINLKSIGYVRTEYKSFVSNLTVKFNPVFLSYDNLPEFLKNVAFPVTTLENIAWICHNQLITETNLHKYTPFPTKERDLVFFMNKLFEKIECEFWRKEAYIQRCYKKDIITNWLSSQVLHFSDGKDLILKYSNKKTITGRINCSDKRFNPQLLAKKSEERKKITSIYSGGKIAVFDFVSFETKISVYLTKDEEFVKSFSDKDIHEVTGQILFEGKNVPGSRELGKKVNHSIVYGIGNDKLSEILSQSNIPTSAISRVKNFLEPILKSSKKIQDEYKKNGFIVNPYKSVVYPQKEWAAYNNYIQSTAADMVVDKLFQIKELLAGRKSRFMYQVYDSFVFDIHPEEVCMIEKIKKKLESNGRYNFDVEYVFGESLWDCTNHSK